MENTGNGVSESVMEPPVTVESLTPSQPKEKRRTRKTERPITPAEAAEILLSALGYCQQAQLTVKAYAENGSLFLSVDGLGLEEGRIVPVTVEAELM